MYRSIGMNPNLFAISIGATNMKLNLTERGKHQIESMWLSNESYSYSVYKTDCYQWIGWLMIIKSLRRCEEVVTSVRGSVGSIRPSPILIRQRTYNSWANASKHGTASSDKWERTKTQPNRSDQTNRSKQCSRCQSRNTGESK